MSLIPERDGTQITSLLPCPTPTTKDSDEHVMNLSICYWDDRVNKIGTFVTNRF